MSRAIIFANGPVEAPDAIRPLLQPGTLLIAADGGARHCLALGLRPQLVVGDLDSLPDAERATLAEAGAVFERHRPEKDETDLELALAAAVGRGADDILVVGALGGRLDMTLANLLLLAHPMLMGRRVELRQGGQRAWLIRPPGGEVRGAPGDTVSLLPLSAARGLTTTGLQYPLRAEALPLGPARGVSNVLTAERAAIDLADGLLVIVHTPGKA